MSQSQSQVTPDLCYHNNKARVLSTQTVFVHLKLICSTAGTAHLAIRMANMERNKPTQDFLHRIPAELLLEVLDHVDYQTAIRLTQVNEYLRETVDLSQIALQDKLYFVLHAQYTFRKHQYQASLPTRDGERQTFHANFACTICFTVKPMEMFSATQLRKTYADVDSRGGRCCLKCSIARRSLRHGVEVMVIEKILRWPAECLSTDYGAHLTTSNFAQCSRMRYCGRCHELHDEQGWATCNAYDISI